MSAGEVTTLGAAGTSAAGTSRAIFTARPRGVFWSVAAISPTGESVKLGIFHHRIEALSAAAVMADACRGRWLP
jgi:hypothetical protein